MIEVHDLHKSFGNKQVLHGVSFSIADGETVAIIGESGCGKSVLIKHIVGLLHPDQGSVTLDGNVIGTSSEDTIYSLRRNIGFLFQNAALFDSMDVFENIVLGLWEHGLRDTEKLHAIAKQKLALVGLEGIEKVKPSELSGGMRKRVGLARALASEPKYMFYDEPTTGLDPVTSDQIDALIADLTNKLSVTSLIITHDLFTVEHIAKRVIFLYQGKVYFDGNPYDLLNSTESVISKFVKRFK
ncbi:MAG TPA: ATP-binding cassette domain-containing protein [Candidatus Kapabacteria bacterium]